MQCVCPTAGRPAAGAEDTCRWLRIFCRCIRVLWRSEAIKKREEDGREEGKEGNKREMDMKEKLLVAHLEKRPRDIYPTNSSKHHHGQRVDISTSAPLLSWQAPVLWLGLGPPAVVFSQTGCGSLKRDAAASKKARRGHGASWREGYKKIPSKWRRQQGGGEAKNKKS